MGAVRDLPVAVRGLAVVLVAAQMLLTGAYVAGLASGTPADVIDFDLEANLPTWWSSVLMLGIAMLCAAIAAARRAAGSPHVIWWVAAVGFVGLSLEEVAQIHEQVGVLVGGGTDRVSVWPLVYLPVLIGGVVVLIRCLRDLPRVPRLMVTAGLVLYCVTIGAELSAISGDLRGPAEVLVEENAELIGAALVLLGLAITAVPLLRDLRAAPGPWATPGTGREPVVVAVVVLAAVQVLLTVGFAAARAAGSEAMLLDLGGEGNLATWWTSTLLLCVAASCAVLAALAPGPARAGWIVAAAAFAAASMQDVARAHRLLGGARDEPVALAVLGAVGVVAACVAVVALRRCAADLPPPARGLALGALGVYVVSLAVEQASAGRTRRAFEEAVVTENVQLAAIGVLLVTLASVAWRRLALAVTRPAPAPGTLIPVQSLT